ncbi:MAG: hypothetical protein JWQ02_933 [Capsulimonas sp.]|nr:hypothetical protein [Capsulimonas sp.]
MEDIDRQSQLEMLIARIAADDNQGVGALLGARFHEAHGTAPQIAATFRSMFGEARALCRLVDGATGETPLTYAVSRGNLTILKTLLTYHIDRDNPRRDGKTALAVACEKGDIAMVNHLLMRSADPRLALVDTQRTSPAHVACARQITARIEQHEAMAHVLDNLLLSSTDSIAIEMRDELRCGALVDPICPPIPTHTVAWDCRTRSELNTVMKQGIVGYEPLLGNLETYDEPEITIVTIRPDGRFFEAFLAGSLTRCLGVVTWPIAKPAVASAAIL